MNAEDQRHKAKGKRQDTRSVISKAGGYRWKTQCRNVGEEISHLHTRRSVLPEDVLRAIFLCLVEEKKKGLSREAFESAKTHLEVNVNVRGERCDRDVAPT